MAGIRTLEKGLPATVKSYATEANAERAATAIAAKLLGIVNVMILPIVPATGITIGEIRYSPVFSCFSDPAPDISIVAHAGYLCYR